jgi:hypothetical protein
MLVKYVSIDGIPQAFVFFRFVDIIVITVHERGIFVIKAAVEMQNNLPFCDLWRALSCIFPVKLAIF